MEVFGENHVFLHAWRVDAAVVGLICLETCGGMGKWRFLVKTMCFYMPGGSRRQLLA